ncbi:MAG: aminodeoxychorismate synthase component I [Gemmataceae bacterium]|nr:aminodeoxychorismate synthase component I [Gemmataceae bacterium]
MDAGGALQFEAVPVRTPAGGPLAVELVPAPDPWAVARRLAHLRRNLLFLDSADRDSPHGRYSYVAADPVQFVGGRIDARPDLLRLAAVSPAPPPSDLPDELPPFRGGVAGLFGYGLGRQIEAIPPPRHDEFGVPDLAAGVYDWVVGFDHHLHRAWAVSTGWPATTLEAVPDRAARRLADLLGYLTGGPTHLRLRRRPDFIPRGWTPHLDPITPQYPLPGFPGVTSNFDRAGYEAAVARAVEYVHAGDVFQVNLSQRLLAPLREHPLDLYGRLRQLNPAPFAGYFDLGDFQVLSASPERFLRVRDRGVDTHPIKGTRPRGRTPEEDAALVADLRSNPKDRAENVMIVDLLRNDLGRVCEYGSVTVPRVCEVESFRYVHHLVSEVRGRLRPACGPLDLLRAAFPGGSVTGAPKVRAMEIIAELEPTARGPYCGALGYIGFDGSMDTNILIRTFTAGRGWVQFPVGGGVVADSDPAREYEETLHKAAGLLRSLEFRV